MYKTCAFVYPIYSISAVLIITAATISCEKFEVSLVAKLLRKPGKQSFARFFLSLTQDTS